MFSEEALQFVGFKIFKVQVEFFNDYFSDIFPAFSLSLVNLKWNPEHVGISACLPITCRLLVTDWVISSGMSCRKTFRQTNASLIQDKKTW